MRFDRPWLLTLLPLAWSVIWLIARSGRAPVGRSQHRWALIARLAAATLLVVAAAGPYLERSVDTRSVLFMLDRSDSIATGAIADQEDFLREALSATPPTARAGIAVFGNGVRLDRAVGPARPFETIRTEVDGSATDLAGALTTAASLLPSEGSRRVIVITDAVPTTTGLAAAAERLAAEGIAVDFVIQDVARGADVLIETVRAPASARLGDEVEVVAVLRSNREGAVAVRFATLDGRVFERTVAVEAGRNQVSVRIPSVSSGFEILRVSVDADFDTRPENNVSSAVYRIIGPARVAVVEGVPGEAAQLAEALTAGGIDVDVRATIPLREELLAFDAVVLVNVGRPGDLESSELAAFVEDLGRGLVVVGGDRSFGLGRYFETALEATLPVSSNPDDLIRRQPIAQVLVIDSSGSMGNCHCREGEFFEGGIVKTEIAKAGAAAAIDALADEDRVGVVAVSGGIDWVLPVQNKPDSATVEAALQPIIPDGDTELARGLRAALDELSGVSGALRHIVLFTDGWDPNEANLVPLAREIADAGITLSVLGTGEGPGVTLRRMAEVGGGRFYPGTDLETLPEIFVEETLTAARGLINEGVFLPTLAAPSPVTAGLEASPPLLGYVATRAKPTASVALQIGPGDPLLASWQRGLGRATAWTSDATTRWSADWTTWEGYVDFWGRLVRQVLPSGRDLPPEVAIESGEMTVTFDAGEPVLDGAAVARVRTPSGETRVIPLAQTGESVFRGTLPAPEPGPYWVAVTLDRADGTGVVASAGAVSGFAEEFAFRPPEPALLAGIADATGGRIGIDPSRAFDEAPNRGVALLPIASLLVAAALILFFADVALRRLVFSVEDAADWREGVRTERRRQRDRIERALREAEATDAPPPVVSGSETLERLMRRKRK